MKLISKIVSGGGRRTRLHAENGALLPIRELRWVPKLIWQVSRKFALGQRPIEPWWPYSVIQEVQELLGAERQLRVIEFGSGGSTEWLAARSESVVAVEDDPRWAEKVHDRLKSKGFSNAIVLNKSDSDYYALDDVPPGNFDLAIIDGSYRWKCIESVLGRMSEDGLIYLDNSDADKDALQYPDSEMNHEAQRMLEEIVKHRPAAEARKFVSFLSAELHVGEGTMVYLGGRNLSSAHH